MMADTEDKVEGTETQETVETKAGLEDSTHESQNEDAGRKSTISRIAEILTGKKPAKVGVRADEPETEEVEPETVEQEEVVEKEAGPEEAVDDTDDKYSEIDPQFVKVARAYGWDDNHIVEYAESHDDRDLVLLTSMMEKQARPVEPSDVVNNEEKKDESPYSGILRELEANDAVGGPVKQLLNALVNELKETKAQLNEVTTAQKDVVERRNRDEWFGRLQTADESFDDAAKEFRELGNYTTL